MIKCAYITKAPKKYVLVKAIVALNPEKHDLEL